MFPYYLADFFELQNVEGALAQNRRVFASGIFGLMCNTNFKIKVCQMISKPFFNRFYKNHRTLVLHMILPSKDKLLND